MIVFAETELNYLGNHTCPRVVFMAFFCMDKRQKGREKPS